jgi:hypothetical protein
MKTLGPRIIQSVGSTIMMGLVSAAMICSINVAPSFGDDGHDRGGRYDNGRYEERGHGHDRDRYEERGHGHDRDRYEHDRRWRRDRTYYGYRERVYVPPPVFIELPRPPGIDIFFPRIIIRP